MVTEAGRLISRKDYDKALNLLKKANFEAKDIYKEFLKSDDLTRKLLNLKKTAPPDISERISQTLRTSEKFFKMGRYQEFNKRVESLIRELRAGAEKKPTVKKKGFTRAEAASFLQTVAFQTLEAQKVGLPTSEIEDLLKKSRDLIAGEFYREAMNLAEEANTKLGDLKREMGEYAHKVDAAEEAIRMLKDSGMNTGLLERLLNKVRAALKDVEYTDVLEHLDRLYEKMDDAKLNYRKALTSMQHAEELIKEAESAGANVSYSTSLLQQARQSSENGDYGQCKRLADEAHEETVKTIQITLDRLHREEMEYKQLESQITEAQEAINECMEYVPIPDAEEMLQKAIELMNEHGPADDIRRLAIDAKALAGETKKQYLETTEHIQDANRTLSKLQALGFTPTKEQEMLVSALNSIDDGNYLEALGLAKEAHANLKGIEGDITGCDESITKATSMVDDVVGVLDTEEVEDMRSTLQQATKSMHDGKFNEAKNLAKRILDRLEDMVATHRDEFLRSKQKLEDMRMSITLLGKEGMNVGPIEEVLASAESALKEKEFSKAGEDLGVAEELLNAIRDLYDRTKTTLTAVHMIMDGMQKKGMDVSDMENRYNRAKAQFEEGKYEEALAIAETIKKESMPDVAAMQGIEEVTTRISEVRRKINLIREGLPEVVDVEEKLGIYGIYKEYYRRSLYSVIDRALKDLDSADTLVKTEKIAEAKELADKAVEKAENIGAKYRESLSSLYRSRSIIARVTGTELAALENTYKKAKSAMESADYDKSIALSTELAEKSVDLGVSGHPVVKPMEGDADPGATAGATQTLGKPSGDRLLGTQSPAVVATTPIDDSDPVLTDAIPAQSITPVPIPDEPTSSPEDIKESPEARSSLDKSWAILKEFEKVGIDVSEDHASMETAETAYAEGMFKEAIELAEATKLSVVRKGEALLKQETDTDPDAVSAQEALDRCQAIVAKMGEKDITHNTVVLLMKRGQEAYSDGRFSAATTFADEALNKASKVFEDYLRAEHLMDIALKAQEGSDKNVSSVVESAKTEFESRNFRYAMRLFDRVLDMLEIPESEREYAPPSVDEILGPVAQVTPPPPAKDPAGRDALLARPSTTPPEPAPADPTPRIPAPQKATAPAKPVEADLSMDLDDEWDGFDGFDAKSPSTGQAPAPEKARPSPPPVEDITIKPSVKIAPRAREPPAPAPRKGPAKESSIDSIDRSEWLAEHNRLKEDLLKLKEKYLQKF